MNGAILGLGNELSVRGNWGYSRIPRRGDAYRLKVESTDARQAPSSHHRFNLDPSRIDANTAVRARPRRSCDYGQCSNSRQRESTRQIIAN